MKDIKQSCRNRERERESSDSLWKRQKRIKDNNIKRVKKKEIERRKIKKKRKGIANERKRIIDGERDSKIDRVGKKNCRHSLNNIKACLSANL